MVYTDIQTLKGLGKPVDYGSGIEYATGVLNEVSAFQSQQQKAGLQVGLWLNGASGCKDIVNGSLDNHIWQLFQYLMVDTKDLARIVYLRVGYEFDNPAFGYSTDPVLYQRAYQYLVHACENTHHDCRHRIQFVWHSWAASSNVSQLKAFYPGDEFVDLVGLSIFSQLYQKNTTTTTLGTRETIDAVLSFARSREKACIVAESTPYGGIDTLNDPWQEWFVPVLDLIEKNNVVMWSYINCDWTSQPMWAKAGFGNTLLSVNTTVLALWNQHVVQNPRFQQEQGIDVRSASASMLDIAPLDRIWTSSSPFQLNANMIFVAILATLLGAWVAFRGSRRLIGQKHQQLHSAFGLRSGTTYGSIESIGGSSVL